MLGVLLVLSLIALIVIAFFVRDGSVGLCLYRPNKKPPGHLAQEVAGERDVAFAVK